MCVCLLQLCSVSQGSKSPSSAVSSGRPGSAPGRLGRRILTSNPRSADRPGWPTCTSNDKPSVTSHLPSPTLPDSLIPLFTRPGSPGSPAFPAAVQYFRNQMVSVLEFLFTYDAGIRVGRLRPLSSWAFNSDTTALGSHILTKSKPQDLLPPLLPLSPRQGPTLPPPLPKPSLHFSLNILRLSLGFPGCCVSQRSCRTSASFFLPPLVPRFGICSSPRSSLSLSSCLAASAPTLTSAPSARRGVPFCPPHSSWGPWPGRRVLRGAEGLRSRPGRPFRTLGARPACGARTASAGPRELRG